MIKTFHRGLSQYYGLNKQLGIEKYGAWVEEIVFVFASSQDSLFSSNNTNNYTTPINK